jgi:hypothetical protein
MSVLLASVWLPSHLPAQQRQPEGAKKEDSIKVGRVLAYVNSISHGAGVGPKYETFLFGVESRDKAGRQIITPIEVVYAYHKNDGLIPETFFDHTKLYELRVSRNPECDASVNALSYEENSDETGKQLPPSNVLRILDGVPKDLLKSDLALPCYILYPGNYHVKK